MILECIDGADDHFQINVPEGGSITLGSDASKNSVFIKELETDPGYLVVANTNGLLYVDGSNLNTQLKINGSLVTTGMIKPTDLLKIGNSVWKSVPSEESTQHTVDPNAPTGFDFVRQKFTSIIGLEELKDFKLQNIFSSVFKKHSFVEMEEQLVTGTSRNTPPITEIEIGWARPWLFSRLLLLSVFLTVMLIMGFRIFENPNLIPGLIFIGSFAMPVATLIFFLEMNVPRNISIFMVFALLFVGGIVSLFVALIFFNRLEFMSSMLGASAAGIIEEWAKLLIVVLLLGRFIRYKWLLNGLLFGAAIGCGFGAFESAGYAFTTMVNNNNFEAGVNSIILRGMLAPFMHVVWTANSAAALWLVKGDKKFEWSMLGAPRFLRVMIASMILHMIWNAPFSLVPLPIVLDLKYLLLGVLAWIICFRLVQEGLAQLNKARHTEIERLQSS